MHKYCLGLPRYQSTGENLKIEKTDFFAEFIYTQLMGTYIPHNFRSLLHG